MSARAIPPAEPLLPFPERPEPDVCANRHLGHENSRAAWKKVRPKAKALRARILKYVAAIGEHGATAEELTERLDLRYTTVSARCSELKRDGLLAARTDAAGATVKRATSARQPADVLIATEDGKRRAALA